MKGRWKKKRFNPGWMLSQFTTYSNSYILSVPRGADVPAIVSFLSSVPGSTKVIPEETYSGTDIYFYYPAPFNSVFSDLQPLVTDTPPRKTGRYRRPVVVFEDGAKVAEFPSILACSKALNIPQSKVHYYVTGKRKTPGKYDIKYKDEKAP